jgi:D-glycero-D-manno-heptose 1,7-bisphosphate phosphatase
LSNKAIFVDRDGVINEMIYVKEHGHVDTPSTPAQFKIIKGVAKAINLARKLGYKVIIISNQPGIAKGYYGKKIFDSITKKMHSELGKDNADVDAEFYCFHHPDAKLILYKKMCSCRKPRAGLVIRAALEYKLNLKNSYFIGDGIVDMEAAEKAGCKYIFVGNVNSTITRMFERKRVKPIFVARDLLDAIRFISDKSRI